MHLCLFDVLEGLGRVVLDVQRLEGFLGAGDVVRLEGDGRTGVSGREAVHVLDVDAGVGNGIEERGQAADLMRDVDGEHVDDHQVEIVRQFADMGLIEPCIDVADLGPAYANAKRSSYRTYVSNTDVFVADLRLYLESIGSK